MIVVSLDFNHICPSVSFSLPPLTPSLSAGSPGAGGELAEAATHCREETDEPGAGDPGTGAFL